MPWIKEVCPIPMLEEKGLVDRFVSNELKKVLQGHGVLDGKIGVDAMTFHQYESCHKLLGTAQFVDGNEPMVRARMIKNKEEIMILEEATAIADAIVQRGIESVRVGRREYEIAGDVLQALHYLGGEYPHLANPFVSSGERMSPPTRFATDKIIRYGDVVFIDIGASWNGYFGDVGRTTICGSPSKRQTEIYTAVYESLMYAIKLMEVGKTTDDVARACRGKASEYGFADNLLFLFIGHGIGISPNEPPYIGEPIPGAEVVKLEHGMVFAMEPLIWVPDVPGGGGVRIEDMVLVTNSGPRILSRAPYENALIRK